MGRLSGVCPSYFAAEKMLCQSEIIHGIVRGELGQIGVDQGAAVANSREFVDVDDKLDGMRGFGTCKLDIAGIICEAD